MAGLGLWLVKGVHARFSVSCCQVGLCEITDDFPDNLLWTDTLPALTSPFPSGSISTDLPADRNRCKGEKDALQGD